MDHVKNRDQREKAHRIKNVIYYSLKEDEEKLPLLYFYLTSVEWREKGRGEKKKAGIQSHPLRRKESAVEIYRDSTVSQKSLKIWNIDKNISTTVVHKNNAINFDWEEICILCQNFLISQQVMVIAQPNIFENISKTVGFFGKVIKTSFVANFFSFQGNFVFCKSVAYSQSYA